jgi:hypothetical protein
MPTVSFIDGTTIHVEFFFRVLPKLYVTVRLFNRNFKANTEIVVY